MPEPIALPLGVKVSTDIEFREGNPNPYRARVRWFDPVTNDRKSKSEMLPTSHSAEEWVKRVERLAGRGVTPEIAESTLADYGESVMDLAMRGLEPKTLSPYMCGWRLRVVPVLGHLKVTAITNGIADRALNGWVADGVGMSTIKNTISPLVRIMEQAVRDGLIDVNPARLYGWQKLYKQAEDELDDPRSLALPDWDALDKLANALVARSHGSFQGWGDVVKFAACTAVRIGEVSGVRVSDINMDDWTWNLSRQTTPSPGGLADKGTKGKRRRTVPLIPEIRPLVKWRVERAKLTPDARLFTGPRGGRITTAVLRDATHWDEVVAALGYEHLRRHDLRHTGLTWMADAGVPLHVLKDIAGHGQLTTTQRYLHPSKRAVHLAGDALSAFLAAGRETPAPVPPTHPGSMRHLRSVG
jgi:integrase